MTENRDAGFVNMLQGKVAGFQVISNGAAGSATVRIRGANSISGNNQPLYVIDGVPIINNVKDGEIDYGNPANNINSDDIESIVVLKGAFPILQTYNSPSFPNILFIRTYMAADISISSRTTKPIHLPTIPRFLTTRIFPTASIGWTAATTNVHGVCQCWECK